MAQRKEEQLATNGSSTSPHSTTNCWWRNDVSSLAQTSSSALYRDFVLISEFSELEGPLPLAVVSDSKYVDLQNMVDQNAQKDLEAMGLTSFDFNAFVLRVVSVDRSSECEQLDMGEAMTPSSVFAESPYLFSIPDDTQVYFTDSEHEFFAFTHHSTLFDINARGYVHPVALSYITRDPDKIMTRFEQLMEQFNEVSLKMKKGNYSNFTLDLKRRLLDLQFTKETISKQHKPALSIQAIEQAVTATKLMIDTLENSSSHAEQTLEDYTPKCIDTLYPVPHFEKKLRSLAQLCQEPAEEPKKKPSLVQKTAKIIPFVFSIIESQHQQSEKGPSFANAIKHDMYSEAIDCIQDMIGYLAKSSVVLSVDEEDEAFVEPIASAVVFGRTFMLNMENPQPREDIVEGENYIKEEEDVQIEKAKDGKETNDEKSKENDFLYPIQMAASQLWKTDKAPTHLLRLLTFYQSLIVDVIFSLLAGRTVLIQGSDKEKVKELVNVLALFVPGQRKDRHQIIEWFDGRLTDAEIGSIKLVGVHKDNMDPSIHMEGSCVLDIDVKNGLLNSSPVYVEGQWINQLLDRMMLFSSDESYLAYLHTVFLTMSLKAFIYHHLYVCDDFKFDDSSTCTSNNKGYVSESNSESSATTTLSRKWSQRLMSYLKKSEEVENTQPFSKTPSRASSKPPSRTPSITNLKSMTTDDEDYSEDNQATVTLQNLTKNNNEKPRTIVGLFPSKSVEPVTTTANATASNSHIMEENISRISTRRNSSQSTDSSNLSDDDMYGMNSRGPMTTEGSFLNFGAQDLDYFGVQDSDSSSDQEVEFSKRCKKKQHQVDADVGPDGVSYTERRGRRFLQDKLKVYGDDQTIVVYLATCVL